MTLADFQNDLHLPLAGYRNLDTSLNFQGSRGYYWSSSPSGTYAASSMIFDLSYVYSQNSDRRAAGFTMRCFKNSDGT